jgi:hypothetical protein
MFTFLITVRFAAIRPLSFNVRPLMLNPSAIGRKVAVSAPDAKHLLATLEETLQRAGIDVSAVIDQLGQVQASEDRAKGKHFAFSDHLRGLVLSLLSNQRPWEPIARNRDKIGAIFFQYDADRVQSGDPMHFVRSLQEIRCGNRAMVKQMNGLAENIQILRRLASEHGSLDAFVESGDPDTVASKLSRPGPNKLKQVGFALALEYLRNVGVRAAKPDLHVRRVLSNERLGYFGTYPSEIEASALMTDIARSNGSNATYLDNLLWMFCAKSYGEICGAVPRCSSCGFASSCNFAQSQRAGGH